MEKDSTLQDVIGALEVWADVLLKLVKEGTLPRSEVPRWLEEFREATIEPLLRRLSEEGENELVRNARAAAIRAEFERAVASLLQLKLNL